MRQPSIIFLLILTFFISSQSFSYAAIKGGIDYSIPIDYSKLSEAELYERGEYYFKQVESMDSLTNEFSNALLIYSILTNLNPSNTSYNVKLGILYDKIKKDRYAKGCFSKAININSNNPEAYFYFGEFYRKRESYRKALNYYNKAYSKGYDNNPEMLYQMGIIYEKLGDTSSALKYLNEANNLSPENSFGEKINKVKIQAESNKEYYTNTRIRKY